MNTWSDQTTDTKAHKRAGGRRRINRQRKAEAFFNSLVALHMFDYQHKTPAEIAAYFNCHLTTAYRYIWRFRGKLRPYNAKRKAARLGAIERAKSRGRL